MSEELPRYYLGLPVDDCEHEAEPYPKGVVWVTEEQFAAEPLRMDWTPPRIVPCMHCGAPLDRGRFPYRVSHPALRNPEPWLDE